MIYTERTKLNKKLYKQSKVYLFRNICSFIIWMLLSFISFYKKMDLYLTLFSIFSLILSLLFLISSIKNFIIYKKDFKNAENDEIESAKKCPYFIDK